jgi:hypothetical protein
MRYLSEVCEECGREIRTLERCVDLASGEEKRAGEVTFGESASEGLRCVACAPDGEDR